MPEMRASLILLALCSFVGCGSQSPPREPHAAVPPVTSPSVPSPTPPPAPPVRLTAPVCSYGGSMPAVSVLLDVESDAPVSGVEASFALRDPSGAPLGSNRGMTLLVAPPDRLLSDLSTQGTTRFDGMLPAGRVRLLLFAGVEAAGELPFDGIQIAITLRDGAGRTFEATCSTQEMLPSS